MKFIDKAVGLSRHNLLKFFLFLRGLENSSYYYAALTAYWGLFSRAEIEELSVFSLLKRVRNAELVSPRTAKRLQTFGEIYIASGGCNLNKFYHLFNNSNVEGTFNSIRKTRLKELYKERGLRFVGTILGMLDDNEQMNKLEEYICH